MAIGKENPLPLLTPHVPKAIVSAVQFGESTRNNGGASMNVNTFHLAKEGDPLFFVGGEPDASGKRIGTEHVPSTELTMPTVLSHAKRIREATGGRPSANLGSWNPGDERPVMLDASSGYTNRKTAATVTEKRNEEAYWDNAKGENVYNKKYDPSKPQV